MSKIYNAAIEKRPVTAVNNLSFFVERGGITGFIGPNGAGKTTSIKMILGLVTPTKGAISLMGERAGRSLSRKKITYISEQPYFYEHLSAEETLYFVAEMNGLEKTTIAKEIDTVLERVELIHRRKAKVKSFSKGMQQRLNMAQALLGNPELIIMDEPMSGLDPLGRRLFRSIFQELKESGVTIFFSTHIVEDIESLCDRIIVLSKGRLKFQGDVKKLIEDSKNGTEFRFAPEQKDDLQIDHFDNLTMLEDADGSCTVTLQESEEKFISHLAKRGIIPQLIQPIRRSLEDILYDQKEEK